MRSRHCGELNRCLRNLDSPFGKGFNFVCAKPRLRPADSRFAEPRISLRGSTACHFLRRAKSNIKSTRDSVLRPRFKALSEKIIAEFSDGTSRTRFFAQNGGEKALNRCDAPVLQRKDLERTAKEQPCSLQTVGYGWVRICGVCGGKGLLGMVIKERLCKRNAFGL